MLPFGPRNVSATWSGPGPGVQWSGRCSPFDLRGIRRTGVSTRLPNPALTLTCRTNASAIYTATYTQMDAEFGNSRIVATLGLSTFVLGIAWGFAWSPLAEFYGRRPIYLSSFAAYMIFIIPSAVAQNIQTMIIARFFQGLAGSAFLSVSGGTVGDLFVRQEMQAPMAVFTIAPFIGPAMGPLFGGLINSYTNWRWTHYVFIIWSFCLLVLLTLFVPETYRTFCSIMLTAVSFRADNNRSRPAQAQGSEAPQRNGR